MTAIREHTADTGSLARSLQPVVIASAQPIAATQIALREISGRRQFHARTCGTKLRWCTVKFKTLRKFQAISAKFAGDAFDVNSSYARVGEPFDRHLGETRRNAWKSRRDAVQ